MMVSGRSRSRTSALRRCSPGTRLISWPSFSSRRTASGSTIVGTWATRPAPMISPTMVLPDRSTCRLDPNYHGPAFAGRPTRGMPVTTSEPEIDLGDDHADITSHDTFVRGVPHATFQRLRREDPISWFPEAD